MINAVIVGGGYDADFIIKTFKKNHVPFVVVNGDRKVAKYLSENNDIEVYCSPTNKLTTYKNLNIQNYDLVVALENSDVRNYIIVTLLKTYFSIKRAICTVNDPNNSDLFKSLGVDAPISYSRLLAERVINDSNILELTKSVTIENGQVTIVDIMVRPNYKIVGKTVAEVESSPDFTLCCIGRNDKLLIPTSNTVIQANDRLVISFISENQKKVLKYIKR